ncbi:MAG: putative minor capsid protein 10B [Prokaryotic dsDNA virus sp.]|nr:MAG: putative minor capsid protein 10B [Prokaryotic dsDNA virus sp.]|tara:strand:- start:2819 stop:3706 length:888 start_codon:yes stop_codon:yes gene_type:complete
MATPSGTIFDTGVTQDFIPELWGDLIYKYFEERLVFKNTVEDYSSLVQGSGKIIHIPEIAKMTASSLTDGAQVSYVAPAETNTQLTIDKHYYSAKLFTDVLQVQSSYDLISAYGKAMGYALAKQVDSDIAAQLITVNNGATLTTDDQITAAEFEAAIANLGENDIDYTSGDVFFVVNPKLYADMLNPAGTFGASFVRSDITGFNSDNSPALSGVVGRLMGMPVLMSNSLSTGGTNVSGVIYHKSACAMAVQRDIDVKNQYDIDVLGTKVVAHTLYGVKLLDDSDNIRGYKFTNAS